MSEEKEIKEETETVHPLMKKPGDTVAYEHEFLVLHPKRNHHLFCVDYRTWEVFKEVALIGVRVQYLRTNLLVRKEKEEEKASVKIIRHEEGEEFCACCKKPMTKIQPVGKSMDGGWECRFCGTKASFVVKEK